MNENLANEIRKTIESVKDMKTQVGGINNYLSILEGLIRADYQKKVEDAYQRGYAACMSENDFDAPCTSCDAYQQGLNEAWEAARKVVLNPEDGGLSIQELDQIFASCTIQQVFRRYTASEAIAKLKAYEEKQADKIKVGDEVVSKHSGIKGILLEPETEDVLATIIVPSQRWRIIYQSHVNLEKTGKHYDIEKLLEALKA